MLRIKICFLGLFFTLLVKGQDAEAFNKIYVKTYLETSQKDFKKALAVSDSLFNISQTPLLQTKSLMLSATLYQQTHDLKKSVDYALKAEKIIEQTNDASWNTRVLGFLSTQYRLLGLYSKSRTYSEKALEYADKIENPEAANSAKGLVSQELAYYNIAVKKYHEAIGNIEASQKYFDNISQNKGFMMAGNKQLLGLCYYNLGDTDLSLKYYNEALALLKNSPENYLNGIIYSGIAEVYMKTSELDKAKQYLDKAVKIADKSEYLQLKKEVYKRTQEYYGKVRDIENLRKINDKKDIVEEKISRKNDAFINNAYVQLENNNIKTKETASVKNIAILIVGVGILCGILFFTFYRKRQKQYLTRIQNILEEHKKRQKVSYMSLNSSAPEHNAMKEKNIQMMPPETENTLLEALYKFEKSQLYKDKNASLSYVASYMETNTKYLSYIIKKHRQKDFTNYINQLRVDYIIEKLTTDPVYRQYKISVLADEAGFSSHSKFATIFKNITDVSPSHFINYINQKKN
ncbi:tetratricopeptide repeat protein [Elizabethkingia anophelis]|uniref:tetratricopeptide repeat protein n=1 Tax=Elizabethkingia anophelis TaxID=1117645 RepID=UPI0004E30C4F|nr:tetratricopeptide repeat protein [Elizabethkingia anophelis]KFC33028.1 AraC family transcriptional regulator [Elizabethkingia anophelis]MCT3786335.1 AraC family transcriptional regulator [Elizabethkingia anophelis]MDV3499716.1 AraC family transcriptional regulator [Elizabethkingia anophelis]PKR30248.1 AraC family transcriptional regulator [Elizabethkingia anophelis]PKR36529.1 AraC family transcriptional regulator [Elizabethkingia anophelis]